MFKSFAHFFIELLIHSFLIELPEDMSTTNWLYVCALLQDYLLGSFLVNSRIFSVPGHVDSTYSFTSSFLKVPQPYCNGKEVQYSDN